MRLFSYCIPTDDGAAPNPYWGICTLTICKPVIRRVAERGDWVVGVGSQDARGTDYSGKLVYAMQVTDKMSLKDYDGFCKKMVKEKIPDMQSSDYRRKVGDCIYSFRVRQKVKQRKGVHFPENIKRDLRGKNALISTFFYYFGKNAISIPDEFSILIRQGQGHQSKKNDSIKLQFIDWITENFRANHLYGPPQIKLRFDQRGIAKDGCSDIRCVEADEDEICSD